MEVTIRNVSSRVMLERTDNGVILYDITEKNNVSSKVAYEIYFKDGIIDFHTMANMMLEIMEFLKIPTAEDETNRKLTLSISKIDLDKPSIGEEDGEDTDE